MAIEPMKRIAAIVPADALEPFTSWLHDQSVLHLTKLEELSQSYNPSTKDAAEKGLQQGEQQLEKRGEWLTADILPVQLAGVVTAAGWVVSARDAQRAIEREARARRVGPEQVRDNVAKLDQMLTFCEKWGGVRQTFLENLFSSKTVAQVAELEDAARKLDADALYGDVADLRAQRDSLVQRLASVERESERLRPLAGVEIPLAELGRLKYGAVVLVRLGKTAEEELDRSCPDTLVWERLSDTLVWFAYPASDEKATDYLASLSAGREEIPTVETTTRERLEALAAEKASLLTELERLDGECREFAVKNGRDVELAFGYWQSEMHRAEGHEKILASQRIGVAHGYLPAAELDRFAKEVREKFKGEVIAEDPRPGEAVPVKLRLHRFFRPAALLVDMFGAPDYFSIDPTPFVAFIFLIFFGLCFSDAIYGIALIAVGAALARKFWRQEGLRSFFQLFVYAGVSTFIFGALLGSWASDLHKYLGAGNVLERIRNLVPHFDALDRVMVGLVGTIFIGIISQYFGIAIRMWRDWRKGDFKGVIFDGGLWFPYLTGWIIVAAGLFMKLAPNLRIVGLSLLGVGGIGLVLTQGRDQESLAGRFLVGMVSLYGIFGAYGAQSFISDTISYSRLLALGLTTGIVGLAFNLLGSIANALASTVSGGAGVGIALFALIVLFGHTFNFFMSIIGAFVHSARLILLEFFGRFYEVGGLKYEPFGMRSERVEVLRVG